MSQENVPPNDEDKGNNHTDTSKSDTTTTTNNNNNNDINTKKKFTLPNKLPSLKESIQDFVIKTNNILSILEIQYHEKIQLPTTKTIHQLSDTTHTIRTQIYDTYQNDEYRQIYGPITILGSSLLVGGITTIRRGRIAGVLSTVMVSGLSYGIIYYGINNNKVNGGTAMTDFLTKLLPSSITDIWKSK